MNKANQHVLLIYDGACPMCSAFGKLVKIRETLSLQIINAREPHPVLEEIKQRNLNLDQGIAVKFKNVIYHGSDALHLLALLSTNQDWFNRISAWLFRSKYLSKLFYPSLKGIRNLLLWYNKVPPINNLNSLNFENKPAIFKSVFGEHWKNLPSVIRKHYRHRPFSNDSVTVIGKMNIHCSHAIRFLIWVANFFKIPVPSQGKNIPVTIHLHSRTNSANFYFDRSFYFPNRKPQTFRSSMRPIKDNIVVESMFLGLGLRLAYHYQNNAVLLKHLGYTWNLFGLAIPLPIGFILGKINTEKHALSEATFRLKVEIKNFFGRYLYSGEFKILDSQN